MANTPPPATTWLGGQQQEYSTGSASTIADASSVQLADASGNTIVDSGVTETAFPATTWTEDDTS